MKVVPIPSVDRCLSLDGNGEIRFWDTSRSNPNDKEERQITSFSCLEDHIRSFEVFTDVGARFFSTHGAFLTTQGRRQQIYRVTDYSEKVSSPLALLFSVNLLMVISVHVKHIVFWSAVTGHEQRKMSEASGLTVGSEVTSAVLDDRLRKLIVGDSNGVISVYNGLTAVKLKEFPSLPFAIRFLIYTPDKTIIAIAGAGDMHVFDELPAEESDAQLHLREVSAGVE